MEKTPYLEFPTPQNPSALLSNLLVISVQMILYPILLHLLSIGSFGRLFNVFKNSVFGTSSTRTDDGDDDVQAERDRIQQLKNLISSR